jgi:hypothetical protein
MNQQEYPPQTNMHVSAEAKLCGLPSCRKPFQPTRHGKREQRFCSHEHQKEFNRLARRVGRAALEKVFLIMDPLKHTFIVTLL